MSDHPSSPNGEAPENRNYGEHNAFDMKRRQFSPLTWAMIVVAGVVLGVAMAMLATS